MGAPDSDAEQHRAEALLCPTRDSRVFSPSKRRVQRLPRRPAATSTRQISARGPVNHAPHGAYPRAGAHSGWRGELATLGCLLRLGRRSGFGRSFDAGFEARLGHVLA